MRSASRSAPPTWKREASRAAEPSARACVFARACPECYLATCLWSSAADHAPAPAKDLGTGDRVMPRPTGQRPRYLLVARLRIARRSGHGARMRSSRQVGERDRLRGEPGVSRSIKAAVRRPLGSFAPSGLRIVRAIQSSHPGAARLLSAWHCCSAAGNPGRCESNHAARATTRQPA